MCKGSASEPQDSKTTPRRMQHYILLVTFHVSVTAVPDRTQLRGGGVHLTSWFQRASAHYGGEGMVAELVRGHGIRSRGHTDKGAENEIYRRHKDE